MSLYSCSWEKELTLTLGRGQWPQACDPNLREHVSGCRECQDLVLVTQALRETRVQSERVGPIGSPGTLWWRAQLRRRNEAIERVTKPVAVAATTGLLGIFAALCVAVWRWGDVARWMDVFQSSSDSSLSRWTGLWAAFSSSNAWVIAVLIAGAGILAFFAGFAVYLLREEA
jgi:hypothetical protein